MFTVQKSVSFKCKKLAFLPYRFYNTLQQQIVSRDDAKFNWLKRDKIISAAEVCKFVELPVFPPDCYPKEFTSLIARNFFLTTQRAALVERIINELESTDENNTEKGMVLSGPYGIGKTCISYLIACYAWVNKYPLIYIVRCFALFVIKK